MLARDGRVPFEVWYLTRHGLEQSHDREFGHEFAWDINMLEGYPHRFLKTPVGAKPNAPFRTRVTELLAKRFRETNTKVLWANGWQVAAYWQALWAAKRAGVEVWLRGESNNLMERARRREHPPSLKAAARQGAKRIALGQLFKRVDHFLCIGTANRELYRSYGVPESKLHMAMYAVDNERFARQANQIRNEKGEIRRQWGIPDSAFCVLFCGKFIPKKRPMDLVHAAELLLRSHPELKLHLLFTGSGELGPELRANCNVVFDAQSPNLSPVTCHSSLPIASFTGFLNQTEVSRAHVAADCLVLPSDYGETWGLVVNEAMASGLPCIISNHCGCAEDLGRVPGNSTYECGNSKELAARIYEQRSARSSPALGDLPALTSTADTAVMLYLECSRGPLAAT